MSAVLNPATTSKQFDALRLGMEAKGWKPTTIGVVGDFYRAVQAEAAAEREKEEAKS